MALVDYSDSNSESEGQELTKEDQLQGTRKRKADHVELDAGDLNKPKPKPPLPPLPTSFHSLYATNVRTSTSDDPSLHAGRTRQVPHVVGNWPTHIYLEWYPSQSMHAILDGMIQKTGQVMGGAQDFSKPYVRGFLRSDLGAQLPLHISLSAPLVLKTEQKEPFQNSITSKLDDGHFRPFKVEVTKLDWVANHDKTRFFLVLRLSKPENDELNGLLSICNKTAQQFGLPQLYEDDCHTAHGLHHHLTTKTLTKSTDKSDAFHISIAWTLKEPSEQARQRLADLEDTQLRGLKVSFSLIKLKLGNAVIDIPFTQSREAGK